MEDPALRLRKVVGKFVLVLAGVWVMIVIAVVATLSQDDGSSIPALNWILALLPGCALVPGAILSVRLVRSDDQARIKDLWVKSAIYGVAGVAIGIGSFIALAQMQNGGT